MTQVCDIVIKAANNAIFRLQNSMRRGKSEDSIYERDMQGEMIDFIKENDNFWASEEVYYTEIAKGLGYSGEISNEFGKTKADIVLYKNMIPFAVVEIKKYKDFSRFKGIKDDKIKLEKLKKIIDIDCYLTIFVTDTENEKCDGRIEDLEKELKCKFTIGEKFPSLNNKGSSETDWEWCFICTPVL